jgi:transcription termination/antitermination protein NusG
MADERTHFEQPAAEGGRSLADDAVSNRSDDTALDEAKSTAPTDRNGLSSAVPDQPADGDENQFEVAGESQKITTGGTEQSTAAESLDLDAADEIAEDAEAEEDISDAPDQPGRVPKPPVEIADESPEEIRMDWYILKVQSNRERSIAEALERKMRIEGLDRFFDQVIVPTEKVTEFKGGKKKVVERKLYPGYIVVHMHINDDTWFAVRETSGVGDFTGAGGKPTPMLPHEVSRIVQTEEEETTESPKLDIKFSSGDKVKVKEGNFENFEGEVNTIDEASGRVTVMINIFGRSTPVELEYWQIEAV